MNLGIVISLRDAFSPVARQVENSYRGLESTLTGSSDLARDMGNAMYSTWNGLSIAMKGVGAMLPVAFSIQEATQFEYQLKAIQTIWEHNKKSMAEQGVEMDKLSDRILNMSSALGTDPTQTAAAYYNILQANINDTEEALHMLELSQKSAIGGLTTPEIAAQGLVSLRNAYGLTMDEMTATSDHLFQALATGAMTFEEFNRSLGVTIGTVREGGLSLEEFYANIATFTLSGGTASEGMTGLKQTLKALSKRKLKSTTEMLDAFAQDGLLPKDFVLSISKMQEYGFNEYLQMLSQAARKADEFYDGAYGDYNDVMQKMFVDVQAKNFVFGVTGQQKALYDDVASQVADSAGALDRAFETMKDSVQHKMDALAAAWSRLKIAIGTPFLKVLGLVISAITKVLNAITALVTKVPALAWAFAIVTVGLGLLFVALGTSLVVIGLVRTAIIGLNWAMGIMRASMAGVAGSVGASFIRLLPLVMLLVGAALLFKKAWSEDWGGIATSLRAFWSNVSNVFNGLNELISTTDGHLGTLSATTAMALQEAGLLDFVVTLYMWWYRLDRFWTGFKEGLQAGLKSIQGIAKGLSESTSPVLKWMGDVLLDITQLMSNLRPKENTGQWWEDLGRKIGEVISWTLLFFAVFRGFRWLKAGFTELGKVISFVGRPIKAVWGVFSRFFSSMHRHVGGIKGIWKGITGAVETAYLKILYFKDGVSRVVKFVAGLGGRIAGVFRSVGQFLTPVIGVIARIGRAVMGAIGILAGALSLPLWAIGLIVAAVVAAGVIIYKNWEPISAFFGKVWDWVKEKGVQAWSWIKGVWGTGADWLKSVWTPIQDFFIGVWHFIRGAAIIAWYWISTGAQAAWNIIVAGANWLWGILTTIFNAVWAVAKWVWSGIVQVAQWAWTGISAGAQWLWGVVTSIFSAIGSFISVIWNAIVAVAQWAWNGIVGFVQWAWDGIMTIFAPAIDWFWGIFGGILEHVWTLAQGFWDGATDMWNAFTETLGGLADWLWDNSLGKIFGWLGEIGSAIGGAVTSGVQAVQEIGKTGEYKGNDYGESRLQKSTAPKTGQKKGGAATGGHIGGEGLTYLHPNELVVSSEYYEKLKSFLDGAIAHNPTPTSDIGEAVSAGIAKSSFLTNLRGLLTPWRAPQPEPPEPQPKDDKPDPYPLAPQIPPQRYAQQPQPEEPTPQGGNATIDALVEQVKSLTASVAALAQRPVHTTVKLNERTLATAVNDHNKSEDARRY